MDDRTTTIRSMNDMARSTFFGCWEMITQGVQALDDVAAVLERVRTFDAFDGDNDPYGEHDFGSFRLCSEKIF